MKEKNISNTNVLLSSFLEYFDRPSEDDDDEAIDDDDDEKVVDDDDTMDDGTFVNICCNLCVCVCVWCVCVLFLFRKMFESKMKRKNYL
jgi:hypothetical protein